MIVQFSTGGRGREQQKRGAMLYLKPDMASLATGSVNFPNGIYENAPEFVEGLARTMLDNGVKPEIEVFDLAMLYNAAALVKKGSSRSDHMFSSCSVCPMRCRRVARSSIFFAPSLLRVARRDVGSRRNRPSSVGSQPVVPGGRRALPHRARK